MLKSQTARVLAAISSYDRRPVTPDVVEDWHALIGSLVFENVIEAVRSHYEREVRGITVSDIRRHLANTVTPPTSLPPYDAAADAQARDVALEELLRAHGVPRPVFERHAATHGFASAILNLEDLGNE